jgi:hypothetical protein
LDYFRYGGTRLEEVKRTNQEDGYQIARALVIVGGILAMALGASDLAGVGTVGLLRAYGLGVLGPIVAIVVGAAALVTAGKLNDQAITISLTVLGFIAGGAGGIMIAIAGILAIISKHALKGPPAA